ncbi:hypothetical protein ARMSODRAFT_1028346 [Armillaria solidipes]|uniref:F-box domain-containing protein n=1 Tax=Armillaria solidipes TaxID=1076256 RepID=A0A2H3B149_9AGAR|nr:hypothetical protein ARMSODRAFT_1028346 [Armillaria solidipes]
MSTYEIEDHADAAFDRVPAEIWGEVFLLTVGVDSFDVARRDGGPWALSQVRSNWRAIAFSLPRLWTNFDLYAGSTDSGKLRYLCYLLNEVLLRSAPHPVEFTIAIIDDDAGFAVLPRLVSVMARWRHISIYAPRNAFTFLASYIRITLDLVSGSPMEVMGCLESVEFREASKFYAAWVWDSQGIFEPALNLREVDMAGLWARDLPYGRLTALSVDGKLGLADAMSLLRDGHQLHELKMPGGLLEDTEELHRLQLHVLVHHAVQVLQIHEPAILRFFRVPSLIELGIVQCILWDPYTNEFATIATFLSHSPALQTITMTVDWFDLGHITDDLTSQMPQLQCLRLNVRCNDGPEDASCIFVDLMKDVLPTLVELVIDGNITLRAEKLAAMLNHRSMIGPGLQYVSLRCADFLASDIECEVLQQMTEDGLELDIDGK